jgi:hypothetical protein
LVSGSGQKISGEEKTGVGSRTASAGFAVLFEDGVQHFGQGLCTRFDVEGDVPG